MILATTLRKRLRRGSFGLPIAAGAEIVGDATTVVDLRGRTVRTLSAIFIAALIAASCSTDPGEQADEVSATSPTGADGTTTVSEAEPADSQAPGVTDDTIKVGVTYPKIPDSLAVNHGDYERAYQAVVDGLNAKDLLHGRQIELVFAPVDPTQSDSATAACTRLTQDEEVFVVTGFTLDDQALCYVDLNETPLVAPGMSDERLEQAKVPWFSVGGSSDSMVDAVQTLIDADVIGGEFAVIGSAEDQALWESRLRALLEEADLEPVVEPAFVDISSGDQNIVFNSVDTILDRFEAEGAEQIFVIGEGLGPVVPNRVSARSYSPQLVVNVLGSINPFLNGEGSDLSSLEGAVAAGVFDAGNQYDTIDNEPTEECLGFLEDAGHTMVPLDEVPEGEERNAVSGVAACGSLYFIATVIEAAGEDLNFDTFAEAGYGLGDLELPMLPQPGHWGPPPSADGDIPAELFDFDPGTASFVRRDA